MYKIKQEYGLNRQIHKQKLTVNGNYQLHKKKANKMQTKERERERENNGMMASRRTANAARLFAEDSIQWQQI